MSGFEVCKRIREKYLLEELPIIMVTAKNQVSDLVEGFKSGANDYISKPFSKHELISIIKLHEDLSTANTTLKNLNENLVKERTAELKHSEERYRLLVELSPDGIGVLIPMANSRLLTLPELSF